MSKIINITEENGILTLKHPKKRNKWSFFWIFIASIFFTVITGDISNFGIGGLCFSLVLGTVMSIPLMLQNREVSLTIDEKFITIEYSSSNDNGDKIIKEMFANENIKRIYAVSKQKYSIYNHYELWIENYKGEETKILGKEEGFVVKKEEIVCKAVDEIRQFLSKNKYLKPKKEVVQKISTPKVKVLKSINNKTITPPRKVTKEQDTAKLKIQDLREGVLFDFHNENWEVIGQVQYDWKLENTDTLYQIKNQRNQISLLFVAQNMAVYTAWIEERVSQYELIEHQLDKVSQNLPVKFTFRESVFLKEHFNVGHEFASKSKNGVKIKQWKYLSEDRKESLRILEHEDKDTFVFWGEKIEEFEFSNILLS
jgi:hypothetical protein